ncbi:type VI secretion system tip protein VgrG [Orbus wheelerorum]|uniref:type VI secretion system Vgr family protein n=1 Tax=Orbus wheelerorum TaxID=3074111 RepID=UPI00370D782D
MNNNVSLVSPLSRLFAHNRYRLTINDLISPISILSIDGYEILDEPWCYKIIFTSSDKRIDLNQVLTQSASLSFLPQSTTEILAKISSLEIPSAPRTLYGVITAFSLLSVNQDEAHYQIALQPRLAMLANSHHNAIYQNQSVVTVVEEVLRKHGFTGIDYRFELNNNYPKRELITQWDESDLEFIQRLLADIGIWFRFETNDKHQCDIIVMSDYEQGLYDGGSITQQAPSGMVDTIKRSVWDINQRTSLIESQIILNDSNYRRAQSDMLAAINTQPQDETLVGTNYRYGEHYAQKSDRDTVESGIWYATIRHQQKISQQTLIEGKSNDYHLMPGQKIIIDNTSELNHQRLIILSTKCYGDRSEAYQLRFTAIPFDELKPYRPTLRQWPIINGTLPARVSSPDNDTYGYIDTQGRYRVKFDYDLTTWPAGQESLWLRLAKPYAGDSYGIHFPLTDGTQVAVAYVNGDPDRPYIAHAMHDSTHPDHVTTTNKHRNVIRTPANNKLRMDDKRGQEHIKLATEYAKTQLNLGHLVDSEKVQRGEGFELRTDNWGAVAANKGLYLAAQTQPKAQGQQLDMQAAITQLENALSIAKALQNAANTAQAHQADTDSQQQLQVALKQLTKAGIIAYAPNGIGLTSDENIQLSSGNSITLTSEAQTDINTLENITLAAGDAVSLFAHKAGIKAFANQGKVEIQAQNSAMDLAAKQNVKIDSVDGKITITATNTITLICGGSYVKIDANGIELATASNVTFKSTALQKMGPSQLSTSRRLPSQAFADPDLLPEYQPMESDNMWFSG